MFDVDPALLSSLLLCLWPIVNIIGAGPCTSPCTPCEDCEITSDDFNREPSDDIGGTFTEESGDWELQDNQFLVNTSAGIAVCNTAHPDGDSTMVVTVDLGHDTAGSACKVIVARVDSDDYFYARYLFRGADGSVEIRKVVSGSDSLVACGRLATLDDGVLYTAKVCTSEDGVITAWLDDVKIISSTPQTLTGDTCALAGDGTGSAFFANFSFSKGYSETAPSCPNCAQPNDPSCAICSDPFTRANNANINEPSECCLEEVNGTWAINSNKLRCTATGMVITGVEHPDGDSEMTVSATFSHDTTNGTVHLMGAVTSGGAAYYSARYTFNGASGQVAITNTGTVIDSATVTLNTNTTYTGKLCISKTGRVVAMLNGDLVLEVAGASPTGTLAGLRATGGTIVADFDDLVVRKGLTDTAPTCEACALECPHCPDGIVGGWQLEVIDGDFLTGTYLFDEDDYSIHDRDPGVGVDLVCRWTLEDVDIPGCSAPITRVIFGRGGVFWQVDFENDVDGDDWCTYASDDYADNCGEEEMTLGVSYHGPNCPPNFSVILPPIGAHAIATPLAIAP